MATYQAKASAYYPANTRQEGGPKDTRERKLNTLHDFLAGDATYVSVAMDKFQHIPYGTVVGIPELDAAYNKGKAIVFKVVDTGDAFDHKGFTRIDICVSSRAHSLDKVLNDKVTLNFAD